MQKIDFKSLPDTSTPFTAENFNQLQDNVENAINAVVESGSNTNGEWIKYADGTMICTGSKSVTNNASTTNDTGGGLYRSSGILFDNFPQDFVDIPHSVSYGIKNCSIQNTPKFILENYNDSYAPSKSSAGRVFVGFFGTTSTSISLNATVTYIAIGRWK